MWAVSRASLVAMLTAVAALAVYVLPGLPDPAAHWPLWDVRVYEWGGRQAAAGGGALYAPGARFSFTYPPFAGVLFAVFSGTPGWALKAALTAGSMVALAVLSGQALDAAGVKRRPETVFAVSALALQTWPAGGMGLAGGGGRNRRGVLRGCAAPLARAPGRRGPDGGERPLRAGRPGRAGGDGSGADPQARAGGRSRRRAGVGFSAASVPFQPARLAWISRQAGGRIRRDRLWRSAPGGHGDR